MKHQSNFFQLICNVASSLIVESTVVGSNSSPLIESRNEEQLEALKQSLTDEFEQLTRQIHSEAQAEQVSRKRGVPFKSSTFLSSMGS